MFDIITNKSTAEKLISKSQNHKSIFAELKNNLSKSNEDMIVEDKNLSEKAKEIKLAQDSLKAEVTANESVIKNIDSILGS